MDKERVVIQVGAIASGAWITSKLLEEHGFVRFTLSSIVREKARILGLDDDRRLLQKLGDDLRVKYGSDYLSREILAQAAASHSKRILIDSIRTPEELRFLKKETQGFVLGIKASSEVRYKLMLLRGNPEDPMSRPEFDEMDARDLYGKGGSSHNVLRCLEEADLVLEHEGLLGKLRQDAQALLLPRLGLSNAY